MVGLLNVYARMDRATVLAAGKGWVLPVLAMLAMLAPKRTLRAAARWPTAILDRRCARHPRIVQAGTEKRPSAEPRNAGSMMQEKLTITRITDRPDLVPIVAHWLWHEFWQHDDYTLEQTRAVIAASVARSGPPQTFVLLLDDQPIGTASLATEDLDERPDLTPWLASVFVVPEARGRGYAARLVAAVEAACHSARISTVWLYTNTAERLYTRAGWCVVETVLRYGKRPVTLMRRNLPLDPACQTSCD